MACIIYRKSVRGVPGVGIVPRFSVGWRVNYNINYIYDIDTRPMLFAMYCALPL